MVSRSTSTSFRIRLSDIDEVKRNLLDVIKMRDDALNDNKRLSIPAEITQAERKIEDIRNSLEDETRALAELRRNAEAQNEIDLLNRQIQGDLQSLIEMKEQSKILYEKFHFQAEISFGMTSEQLENTTQNLFHEIAKRDDSNNSDLSEVRSTIRSIESRLSHVSAILNHSRHQSSDLKLRRQDLLNGAVQIINQIGQSIIQGDKVPDNEKLNADPDPQGIIQYLNKRISDSDIDSPESIRRTIKKLKYLPRLDKTSACPCCKRSMDEKEYAIFNESMGTLADLEKSEIIKLDRTQYEENSKHLKQYERWRAQGNY